MKVVQSELPNSKTTEDSVSSTPGPSNLPSAQPSPSYSGVDVTDKIVWTRTKTKGWLVEKIEQELCDLNVALDILERWDMDTTTLLERKLTLIEALREVNNGP